MPAYSKIKASEIRSVGDGFTLYRSRIGAFISGEGKIPESEIKSRKSPTQSHSNPYVGNCNVIVEVDDPYQQLPADAIKNFLTLEGIGINLMENEEDFDKFHEQFVKSIIHNGTRFEAPLPWIEDRKGDLAIDFGLAFGRLNSLYNQTIKKDKNILYIKNHF